MIGPTEWQESLNVWLMHDQYLIKGFCSLSLQFALFLLQWAVPGARAPRWHLAQDRCGHRTWAQVCEKHLKDRGKTYENHKYEMWLSHHVHQFHLFSYVVHISFSLYFHHGLENPRFLFEMNAPEHLSDTPAFILLAWACSTSAPRSYISTSFWQLFWPLLIVLTLGNCGCRLHHRRKRQGEPACSEKVHGHNRFCNRCRCEMCPRPRNSLGSTAGWRWCVACGRLGGPYFTIIHAMLLGTHSLVTWPWTRQHTFIDMRSCV